MPEESPVHINGLELHAAKLTLMTLAPSVSDSHIRLMLDNTTAAAHIDKIGGLHSPVLAKARNNWLSTAFIPGVENTVADFHSRNFPDNTEWMLNPVVFPGITQIYFAPDIDLFASRLNCQLHPFVSWQPEPGAWAINAFSICWADFMFYAFPPFSILGKVLAKVQQDGATGMLVTPLWPTQPWFPQPLELVIEHPRVLKPGKHLLQLQGKLDVLHPLHSKLSLLVTVISGQPSKVQAYLQQLQPSFVMPGGNKEAI